MPTTFLPAGPFAAWAVAAPAGPIQYAACHCRDCGAKFYDHKLVSQVGRVDYARVRIVADQVEPLAISGASILTSTTTADGFVMIPADSEGYPAGAEVEVHLYDIRP